MLISLSFTLKGQDLSKIEQALLKVKEDFDDGDLTIVHGFLPREVVIQKNFDTGLVDMLDKHFPKQYNLFDVKENKPLREQIAHFINSNNGKAIFVGEIKDGVEEEFHIYQTLVRDFFENAIIYELE